MSVEGTRFRLLTIARPDRPCDLLTFATRRVRRSGLWRATAPVVWGWRSHAATPSGPLPRADSSLHAEKWRLNSCDRGRPRSAGSTRRSAGTRTLASAAGARRGLAASRGGDRKVPMTYPRANSPYRPEFISAISGAAKGSEVGGRSYDEVV